MHSNSARTAAPGLPMQSVMASVRTASQQHLWPNPPSLLSCPQCLNLRALAHQILSQILLPRDLTHDTNKTKCVLTETKNQTNQYPYKIQSGDVYRWFYYTCSFLLQKQLHNSLLFQLGTRRSRIKWFSLASRGGHEIKSQSRPTREDGLILEVWSQPRQHRDPFQK